MGGIRAIKSAATAVAPIAPLAMSFLMPQSVMKGVNNAQVAMGAVNQVGSTVNNTIDSAKNARQTNKYHNKLNNPYGEKVAFEKEDVVDKNKKRERVLAKAAPYTVGGTLLLAYGAQAIKDKSLKKPIKDAVAGIPASAVDKIRKKSNIVNGLVKGGRKGLKKANSIIVNKPKQTPLESFANGAAWGAGVLGIHMLGDAFFKNKNVSKNYEKAQPGQVKAVKLIKEVKEMADKNKKEETQEKTASIKGAELLKNISDKALDAGINLSGVNEYAIKNPVAVAGATFLGKEIAGAINRRVKKLAKAQYLKKLNKNKDAENKGEEKTAGIKDVPGKLGEFAKKYVRDYGQSNLTNLIKPVAGAVATIPLIYGKELLDQKRLTKKIQARQAEKENQEKEDKNNGRNYKGGKRENDTKHNI